MNKFPGVISSLGSCKFLLNLLGRIIFVLESALIRKELINEGIKYLFESEHQIKLLSYEYYNLKRLSHYKTNSFNELFISSPEFSWGEILLMNSNEEMKKQHHNNNNDNDDDDGDDDNANICTRIMSEIATKKFNDSFISLNSHSKLLPTIPETDYSLRLSVGGINHENYIGMIMSLKHFFTYSGLTICLNSLLKYFSLHSDEEIRFDWKETFPNSWEIWNRIFDLDKSKFINTPINQDIQQIYIKIPINMTSLRSFYPSFARLLGALGDTSININNAIITNMHLFTILYECDNHNRKSSPDGSLILKGLYNIHTGRLIWSNTSNPDIPYQAPNSTENFVEFIVDYSSISLSDHINFDLGEDISSNMTEKDLIVTFVTSIRLHTLFGSWLPSITFDDASFIIHPYKSYATNDSTTEIIGCIVRSLGFKANTGTISESMSHDNDDNHSNNSSTSTDDYHHNYNHNHHYSHGSTSSSWLSNWSISHFITYGLENFIKIFQRTFLLSLYVNSPPLNSNIESVDNFFTFLFYFHLPEKSFLLTIFIYILKYLFLHLQVYLTIFNLLHDLFDSISKDLMRFNIYVDSDEHKNQNENKLESTLDIDSNEIEQNNSENNKERFSWYCGNKEKILELENERNLEKQNKNTSNETNNHTNTTLLGSIGGYVTSGNYDLYFIVNYFFPLILILYD